MNEFKEPVNTLRAYFLNEETKAFNSTIEPDQSDIPEHHHAGGDDKNSVQHISGLIL